MKNMDKFVIKFKEKKNSRIEMITWKAESIQDSLKKFYKKYPNVWEIVSHHNSSETERRLNTKPGIPSIVEILD